MAPPVMFVSGLLRRLLTDPNCAEHPRRALGEVAQLRHVIPIAQNHSYSSSAILALLPVRRMSEIL
jgi:hypothetical protein